MKSTYLVQRLQKPFSGPMGTVLNGFAFGGGLRNGGLSDEAMTHLGNIFSFDYMGSAEFEFGAVPKALHHIAATAENLEAFTVSMLTSSVKESWKWNRNVTAKKPARDSRSEVFVIAAKDFRKQIVERITKWAREDYNSELKSGTRLNNALRPVDESDNKVCGWLELDNGFFFFTDRNMFKAVASLFGVTTGGENSVERV